MALLHLLCEASPGPPCSLEILHLNHQLRGADSDADEQFVLGLASVLGLQCHTENARLDPNLPNLEERARDARLDFFARVSEDRNLAGVVLAHTRDDQAETVLYRILRGTGLPGLSAMAPVSSPRPGLTLIRPVLSITRDELRRYLQNRNLPWREDTSNADPRFDRNRIRHQLLPQLSKDWNPRLTSNLARLAWQAGEEEDSWKALLAPYLAQSLAPHRLGLVTALKPLKNLPIAVLRRVFRKALDRLPGTSPDAQSLQALALLAASPKGSGEVSGPGFRARRSFDQILLSDLCQSDPQEYFLEVHAPGSYPHPGTGGAFRIEVVDKKVGFTLPEHARRSLYNSGSDFLDGDRLSGPLVLRSWQPGDRFQSGTLPAEERLKSLFHRHRIPSWERKLWPILLCEERIVWTRQFGAAKWAAAGPESGRIWSVVEEPAG